MVIKNHNNKPFFSICVPQHNRTKHLIEACRILARQTFNDFEVCISDDCSTDGLERELIDYLSHSTLFFAYKRQQMNRRYDANLRASISLASGVYCILCGNDDCLRSNDTLLDLHDKIVAYGYPSVVITNYEDWQTGNITKRVFGSELIHGGIDTAVKNYRNVAFVSGVIVSKEGAVRLETDRWDGSEMYQMYIVASLLAEGGNLLKLDDVAVRQNIIIPGEAVDSFRDKKIPISKGFVLNLPIQQIGRVVSDAVLPHTKDDSVCDINEEIFVQLYKFTFPYWIMQYKNAHGWYYSFRYVLSISPFYTMRGVLIRDSTRIKLYLIYSIMGILGLFVPFSIYELLETKLHSLAKGER